MKKPDWKLLSDYPSEAQAKEMSLDQWAYLFLSRNCKFLADLKAAKELSDIRITPDKMPVPWNRRPIGVVLSKWGVMRPPLMEDGDGLLFEKYPIEAARTVVDEVEIAYLPDSKERVVLGFDLSEPIGPQITRAKALLLARQKAFNGPKRTNARPRVTLFPAYLRVLDAIAAGATSHKMLEVFSLENENVDDSTIRNWKNAAEALRDGGYRKLAKSPES